MADISTKQLILRLQKLKDSVLKDGVIDWDETEQLKFWLTIVLVAIALVVSLALVFRIISST